MDHQQGRAYIRGIVEHIQDYKTGQLSTLNLVSTNMAEWSLPKLM